MTLNYNQKRLIVLIRKRFVTDTLAWIILWMLIIGYIPIHIYSKYEFEPLFFEQCLNCLTNQVYPDIDFNAENLFVPVWKIVFEAGIYVFGLMFLVYFNLEIIKKYTLDKRNRRSYRYVSYLIWLAIVSFVLALIWSFLVKQFPGIICMRVEVPRATLIHYAFALLSTGLIYLKDLKDIQSKKEELEEEVLFLRSKEKSGKPSLFADHIIVGTPNKWERIYFKDILFLEAEENLVKIQTEFGITWSSNTLKEFNEILPSPSFLQIYRSFIININKVVGREKNHFHLRNRKGKSFKSPKTTATHSNYWELIEKEPLLRFE